MTAVGHRRHASARTTARRHPAHQSTCGACATLAALLTLGALVGCERQMRDMYSQPKLDPGEASPLFADGKASRPPPPGAVVRTMGDLAATSSGRRDDGELMRREAASAALQPPALGEALLQRGRERFSIYCLPCHGALGDGNGPVALRGFPHPPTFHQPRLRAAPDRHLFDVITQGYGVMVPYADRVTPEDRWAIVAYLRALQLSQHATFAELPSSLQARLRALPPTAEAPTPSPPSSSDSASAPPPSERPASSPARPGATRGGAATGVAR